MIWLHEFACIRYVSIRYLFCRNSPHRTILRSLGLFCVLLQACIFGRVVTAEPPDVKLLIPPGGQRGTKIEVTCDGKFSWPLRVSAPGVDVVVTDKPGVLEVSIPADIPADRVWLRLYNDEGAASPLPFMIGSLPEAKEIEPNNSLTKSQVVDPIQTTVNGQLERNDVDCYVVQLKRSQTLVAAVIANHRMGAPMDGVLQIVSPDGFILAECHDDVRLDPLIAFQAPKAGTYHVRIAAFPAKPGTSINFAGDKNYLYRLTLTTGPYVTHAIPSATLHNDLQSVQVVGWNLPAETRLPVVPFGGPKMQGYQEFESLAAMRLFPDDQTAIVFSPEMAGTARLRMVRHHYVVRTPPAANNSQQIQLSVPSIVTGWLREPRQVDSYLVPLKKDEPTIISVEGNRIESMLHPYVTLADPSGTPVPETVFSSVPQRDLMLNYTPPTDGNYILTVRDSYGVELDRHFYRLSVRPDLPDFELTVAEDALVVPAGLPVVLPIQVTRRGPPNATVGPITIRALGLPDGTTAPDVVSEPTGETATAVKMVITSTGSPFSGRFRVKGTVETPQKLERYARTAERLDACFESIWVTITP
ncbi:MAG: PPC domain-containing protein [Planctomycetota bacterium]|nr:PPC domain-containing protein [Planctomycetota bacterium]MDA1179469.1 PPC domain-containing protein [Planctomycetota bacterium]